MCGRAVMQEVGLHSNLKELLDGCVVHEYPTLYVVL